MSKILISYRREDRADVTGRIYDRLIQQFGRETVFKDVDSIPFGVDFRTYLDEQVAKCDVFLAVIGRDWMRRRGSKGKSKLENPGDFVRIEIESALKRQILVIPLLARGASPPLAERLPASIQDLSYRHGIAVRPDPDFHRDMDRLIDYLKEHIQGLKEGLEEKGAVFQKAVEDATQLRPGTLTETSVEGPADVEQPIPSESPPKKPIRHVPLKEGKGNQPEGMVLVPKGSFFYGPDKRGLMINHDYWIGIYPVTNEEFKKFISANGYQSQAYWSASGWTWRTKNNIECPRFWDEPKWTEPDYPVVGVSYYEAEAYATWAGKRLLTEEEWEKATRGEDGREYPCGEEFDQNRCNSFEAGIYRTTPVTKYPDGISPYGCYDMAGNVWEWCASWYDEKAGRRVIRGGSWVDGPEVLRSSDRARGFTGDRSLNIGFRLAQSARTASSRPGAGLFTDSPGVAGGVHESASRPPTRVGTPNREPGVR